MNTPSTLQRGNGGTGDRRTVPLTQLIHLMAEYQKLGEHRQTFLTASMSGDTFVRGCGMIAGGLAIVAGICATAGWWVGSGTVAAFALIALLAAALRGRLTGHSRSARLDLFDYGLTVFRSGQEIRAFRWETLEVRQEVIPFHSTATPSAEYSFVLTGPGGMREAFDGHQFASATEWGPLIQSAVTATQLPGAVAAIDAELTVHFGEVAVDLRELAFAGSGYPWEQVQKIESQGGLVRIKFDGRWISLAPVESIPNFYIFNEVIERLRIAAAEELAEDVALQSVRTESGAEASTESDEAESETDSTEFNNAELQAESVAAESAELESESESAAAESVASSAEAVRPASEPVEFSAPESSGTESAGAESAEPSDTESVGIESKSTPSEAVDPEPKPGDPESKPNDSESKPNGAESIEQSSGSDARRAASVGPQTIVPEPDEPVQAAAATVEAPARKSKSARRTLAGRRR